MAALRLLLCATCLYVSLLSASRTVFQESPHAPPLWIDGERTGCCADSDGHFARCVYFTGLHGGIETKVPQSCAAGRSDVLKLRPDGQLCGAADSALGGVTGRIAGAVFHVEGDSVIWCIAIQLNVRYYLLPSDKHIVDRSQKGS